MTVTLLRQTLLRWHTKFSLPLLRLTAFFVTGFMVVCMLAGVSGCSSKPKPNYERQTYRSISASLFSIADHKRQLGQLNNAKRLYLQAERYALLRNDKTSYVLSMLKRANIAIIQGEFAVVENLLSKAKQVNQQEGLKLAPAISFIQAKFLNATNKLQEAINIIRDILPNYEGDAAKRIFYQTYLWYLGDQQYSLNDIERFVKNLAASLNEGELANIEIYSFVLFSYFEKLVELGDVKAITVFEQVKTHFGKLELTNKLSEGYLLMSQYYQSTGQKEKSAYFSQHGKLMQKAYQSVVQ